MRRRSLVGTAVAVVSLIIGVGVALAAAHGTHHHKRKVLKPTAELLHCTSSPTTVPPQGQANVDQPPSSGDEYGPITCTSNGFGSGLIADTFTVPDSGDKMGTWTAYFDAGTVKGTFDYQPGEGQPIGANSFAAQDWEGQVTVTSGTGVYQGVKGKNNKGTGSCSNSDSVHSTCSMNVTVLIPAGVVLPPSSGSGGSGSPSGTTGTTGPTGAKR